LKKCVAIRVSLPLSGGPGSRVGASGGSCRRPLCADRGFECPYTHDGRSGNIHLLLWPVNFSLTYARYEVLTPFVAYGVEAGLRYSDPSVVELRLHKIVSALRTRSLCCERAIIPFNHTAESGDNGRILPAAPVYSPFVRRKERLKLD
jgi:NAD(P)H dehydrogenase (quinone)